MSPWLETKFCNLGKLWKMLRRYLDKYGKILRKYLDKWWEILRKYLDKYGKILRKYLDKYGKILRKYLYRWWEIPWQIRKNTGPPSSWQPLSSAARHWSEQFTAYNFKIYIWKSLIVNFKYMTLLVWILECVTTPLNSTHLSNGYCLRRAISRLEGAMPECLFDPTYFVPWNT